MTSLVKVAAVFGATVLAAPAMAQTKVSIAISGWTGFAPLTLAKEAGIFAKNGLDVTIKKIPQASRHLAIASGDVQCAATTVETWVVWNANGVATTQIFQLDKSYGADGMVVKPNIAKITDLKGKTVAASAPGTAPYDLSSCTTCVIGTPFAFQTTYVSTVVAAHWTSPDAIARWRSFCGIFLIVTSRPFFLKMPAWLASVSGAKPVHPEIPMATLTSCATAGADTRRAAVAANTL